MEVTPNFQEFDFPDLHGPIVLDTENHDPLLKQRGSGWPYDTHGLNGGKIIGVAVKCANVHTYLPIGHTEGNLDPIKVKSYLSHQLTKDVKQPKIFANIMYDAGWFAAEGIKMEGVLEDVMFQAPLIDENRPNYSLDRLGKDFLNIGKDEDGLLEAGKVLGIKNTKKDNVKAHLMRIHPSIVGKYAMQDVEVTDKLWQHFNPIIEAQELQRVYQLEMDLVPMLIAMRMRGVRVDVEQCRLEQKMLVERIATCRRFVEDQTGVKIGSWDNAMELSKIFDKLGIKYERTEKTDAPSITASWLRGLGHPVADSVLIARKATDINSTFLENALLGLQENGRVYPNFNSLRKDDDSASGVIGKEVKSGTKGTVSGRFSSTNPNFQQIPSPERDPELGHLVRKLILPEEGDYCHGLDYSSQEPRGIVHFAEVTGCLKARQMADKYRENPDTDFHEEVREMVATHLDEWKDPAKRKPAKIIGLGIAYGMGGGKLAFSLGLPYTEASFYKGDRKFEYLKAGPEAQALLNLFNDSVPFIKELSNKCQQAVRQKGYIKTPLGRRFRFPRGSNGQYDFLNKALNRLIQGTSADMTKTSLRELWRAGILPMGTVHDENVFSSRDPKEIAMAKEIMETCFPMNIPSKVDVGSGLNWGDASLPKLGSANYEKFRRGESL